MRFVRFVRYAVFFRIGPVCQDGRVAEQPMASQGETSLKFAILLRKEWAGARARNYH